MPKREYGERELQFLKEALESGNLGSMTGKFTPMFEEKFASMVGTKHAVAMNCAMSVLHASVLCADLGIEPGGEVLCDAVFVFGAQASMYANLVPRFVDVDPVTYNMDPAKLEEKITKRTKAAIVTHAFGLPADMDPIAKIAQRHDILLIEDCAHAILATYKGRFTGSLADIGAFSFQASKQMSLGDGGIATTRDEEIAKKLDLHASAPTFHSIAYGLHYNYRMNELTAAVGLAQLERMPAFIEGLKRNATYYDRAISSCKWLKLQKADYADHTYWFWAATFEGEAYGISLDRFKEAIKKAGLSISVGWTEIPPYKHPVIKDRLAHILNCRGIKEKIDYPEGLCPIAERTIPRMVLIYTLKPEEIAKEEAEKFRQFIVDLESGRI